MAIFIRRIVTAEGLLVKDMKTKIVWIAFNYETLKPLAISDTLDDLNSTRGSWLIKYELDLPDKEMR